MTTKQQILTKLNETSFPDLAFFNDAETLKYAEEVLEELLEQEKQDFQTLLDKADEETVFDDYEDDSLLDYFWSILNHLENTDSCEKKRAIIENFMPKLQDFGNECAYSKRYFEKIQYSRKHLQLDADQKRILDEGIKAYKDRWINLPESTQNEIKQINKKLGELSNTFTNNIVDDRALFQYEINDFEVIKELPKDVLESVRQIAIPHPNPLLWEEKGIEQNKEHNVASLSPKGEGIQGWGMTRYLFTADPTVMQAIAKYCSDPKIREDFSRANYTFASSGKYDNRPVVLEILQLKDQKAKLLGYKNYAELSLNAKMAESPEQIFDFIGNISKKAKTKAETELEELKKYFSLSELKSSDIAYYSRKLKEEKYELNEEELKQYFELENTLNYMFSFVQNFYGIEIKPIENTTHNPDIRVYEVWKEGKQIAYYFQDLFYRKEKRQGAWADNLRSKYIPDLTPNPSPLEERGIATKLPVVLNVCNFMKNENGKTTLYMRDVETLFHEFGHALHEMLSESRYSSLSGFNVEWDFVELPSQLMENWVGNKESLRKLAKHYETGEKIPETFIEKMEDLKYFMTGNFVARQNEFALLDMNIYANAVPKNVEELDEKTLEVVNTYGITKRGPDYKMYASFGHIFGGGYAAGYYSYMWAELLEADVWERIKEMGMFDAKTGEKLLKTIIGQGSRKPAGELFKDFMGREPKIDALLKRYGI